MSEADFRHSIQASNQDPIPRDIVLQVRLEEQGAKAVLQRLYREVEILAPLLAWSRPASSTRSDASRCSVSICQARWLD